MLFDVFSENYIQLTESDYELLTKQKEAFANECEKLRKENEKLRLKEKDNRELIEILMKTLVQGTV